VIPGFTYELCAGLIDKQKAIKQICKEEIAEEVGYDVPLDGIHELSTCVSSSGTSGAKHTMFYAEVGGRLSHEDKGRSSGSSMCG